MRVTSWMLAAVLLLAPVATVQAYDGPRFDEQDVRWLLEGAVGGTALGIPAAIFAESSYGFAAGIPVAVLWWGARRTQHYRSPADQAAIHGRILAKAALPREGSFREAFAWSTVPQGSLISSEASD